MKCLNCGGDIPNAGGRCPSCKALLPSSVGTGVLTPVPGDDAETIFSAPGGPVSDSGAMGTVIADTTGLPSSASFSGDTTGLPASAGSGEGPALRPASGLEPAGRAAPVILAACASGTGS